LLIPSLPETCPCCRISSASLWIILGEVLEQVVPAAGGVMEISSAEVVVPAESRINDQEACGVDQQQSQVLAEDTFKSAIADVAICRARTHPTGRSSRPLTPSVRSRPV